MKNNLTALALVFVSTLAYGDAYSTLLRRYENQIKGQEKQLTGLRERLQDKEKDVQRWKNKADDAKSAWNASTAQLDQTRTKMKTVREKRMQVRIEADAAQWKTAENVLLSRSAQTQSRVLALDLYANTLLQPGRSSSSLNSWQAENILSQTTQLTSSAEKRAAEAQREEALLRTEEMRWQTEEQSRAEEVSKLHQTQDSQYQKWQEALRRKASIEDEIARIDQSAKALQVMLQELREHRDQARALQDNRPLYEKALATLKGSLPWPARGRVVQNFGRQYSEGLNQLVVSNGIKIDAGENHTVRVVQDGKVIYASPFRSYGQLVIVQHKNALTSVYASLAQTQVKEGQMLTTLDQIGTTGTNGAFYFELRHNEQPINPLVYLTPAASSALSLRRTYR